jgi:MFS family permease
MHSHITDLGMSGMQASAVIALMTLMGAIAKPLFGVLADYFDKRAMMAVAIALQALGVGLLLRVESYPALMTTGFVFGLGYGAVMPLWSVLLGAMFGRDGFARVMGVMGPMTLPFTMVGLPLTTLIFERTGSYLPAFAIFLAFFIVSATALVFLRVPREARES